jgi:coenzyme Q-binding protein COQ10
VAEVEQYKNFIPYCTSSVVTSRTSAKRFTANLTIGIPPLLEESYESDVTLTSPTQVKSVSAHGNLFNYMESIWKFSPGPNGDPKSCTFDFYMSFEFRSLLHSQISQIFFDQGVRKIVDAFTAEAKRRYGPSSI